LDWFRENGELTWWLLGTSAVVFVVSLAALREALIRIPPDYFNRKPGAESSWRARRPVASLLLRLAKNLLGALLLIAGVVMLLTPGQGILAIILGVSLLDLPGKRALERKLVGNDQVFRGINKLRAKAGRPPLERPQSSPHAPS
jgi:hypothetical protein